MKEFEINTIKEISKILSHFVSNSIEFAGLDKDKFNFKNINNRLNKMEKDLKPILEKVNLEEFSCEALEAIGFTSVCNNSIMLIPKYLLNSFSEDDETEVFSIYTGEFFYTTEDDIIEGTRNGCVPHGIKNNEIKELMKTTEPECNGEMENQIIQPNYTRIVLSKKLKGELTDKISYDFYNMNNELILTIVKNMIREFDIYLISDADSVEKEIRVITNNIETFGCIDSNINALSESGVDVEVQYVPNKASKDI